MRINGAFFYKICEKSTGNLIIEAQKTILLYKNPFKWRFYL